MEDKENEDMNKENRIQNVQAPRAEHFSLLTGFYRRMIPSQILRPSIFHFHSSLWCSPLKPRPPHWMGDHPQRSNRRVLITPRRRCHNSPFHVWMDGCWVVSIQTRKAAESPLAQTLTWTWTSKRPRVIDIHPFFPIVSLALSSFVFLLPCSLLALSQRSLLLCYRGFRWVWKEKRHVQKKGIKRIKDEAKERERERDKKQMDKKEKEKGKKKKWATKERKRWKHKNQADG